MRHPFLRALLPAILAVVAGRELQQVEITAAPTMYPVKCNEVPTDRKVKFPNSTVGYRPTWYDRNRTSAPSPGLATGTPSSAPAVSDSPIGGGNGPGLPTTGAPSSAPATDDGDGGERVDTAPPTGVPLTGSPTGGPTDAPTGGPTGGPTDAPTGGPTDAPTDAPTGGPTSAPTSAPTSSPTDAPTDGPTGSPTAQPTSGPTDAPTDGPTGGPTSAPTDGPTSAPTGAPTAGPTDAPTSAPTSGPTSAPTSAPTGGPTSTPTAAPTAGPTSAPTAGPTATPTAAPTSGPTATPTSAPTATPTSAPTSGPTSTPSAVPTKTPTKTPTSKPTATPTKAPTNRPTTVPTAKPTTKMECPVVELGFEGVSAGTYVTTQFRQKYGVRISATAGRGGITANGPRVFDSANQNGGDIKLMSPNSGCGGQGSGAGGAPASAYRNCDPLGNILLVQINTTDKIQSNLDRSYIIFDFDEPIKLVAATFLESTSEKNAGMELTRPGLPLVNVTLPKGGVNGKVRQVFGDSGVGVTQLRVRVERTGAVASLEYTWCLPQQAPTSAPTTDSICPKKKVDFQTLKPNTYVRYELMKTYQLELTAKLDTGGYSPGGRVMVMDSSKPSKADPDLGSPNEACGGPGKGAGGANGTKYQNCEPLGNIIFVQQNNTASADNYEGKKSTLIFRFNGTAVTLHSFTLLDADGTVPIQTILYLESGATKYIYTPPTGDNGVVKVDVSTEMVIEFRVVLPNGGAVADLEFTSCALMETPAPTYAPTCPDVDLDFNLLLPGSYIGDELWAEYGIKFQTESVGGGYRPNNTARVFDSSNPGNKTHGSPDIGSPNESCNGTGIGLGGHFTSRYANCGIGQGNVLIIQSDKANPVPQYYTKGANKFKIFFKVASFVESIDILVGHNCKQMKFTVIQEPYKATYLYSPLDVTENGLFTQIIGLQNVIRIDIDMPFGGALADIKYTWCPSDTKAPSQAPVRAGLPTIAPTKKPTGLSLPAPSMQPIEYRTDCDMTVLDFEGMARGQYITGNFLLSHGVTISAKSWNGGYVPSGAARIFDTSDPGEIGIGDPDLGSPNESCGGPGIGSGGARGSAFENCEPLGNVLTVQSTLKATPDDHENGFEITFSFIYPVYLESAQVMDNDGCNCDPIRFTMYLADGSRVIKTGASATGNNGVAWVYLATERVVKVGVYFPTSGAISSLNYIMCLPELLKKTILPNAPLL